MSARAAIAEMHAPELRRSALMQLVELRRLYEKLATLDLASLPQSDVDALFMEALARNTNFDQTIDRVEELAQ